MRFSLPLLLLALTPLTASAQVTAAISGRVEDPSGGAVSGATITVKSLETNATRTAASDNSGVYSVLSLPLGPQEVKVEKTGFQPIDRTGINLRVGQNARLNFQLQVGTFVSQVTVSEETPVVNITTSPVSGLVGDRQVKDLPLNGRSFDNLVTLNPGAINYNLKSAGTSTSNGNTFTVAGRRPMDNIVLLNGIEYTGSSQLAVTPGGASGEMLGIDAVREFNLLTDTYSAAYGKRSGGQVSVVTQSGSNVVHGSLFEFLRNSALDARNFFDQAHVPPFRRNQFGGALGGPIRKDRFFLFGNYEGFRQALAVSSVSEVPDQQARLGNLPNAAGVYAPVANLNSAMLKYFALWPQVNAGELLTATGAPSGVGLSYNNPRQSIREDFGTTRADYTIGDYDTLTAAYTIDDGTNLSPAADPLFASYLLLRAQVASLQEIHIFSPHILNTVRIGFSRAAFNFNAPLTTSFPSSLSYVTGDGGPGGIVIGGGVTTTGASAITSAGPNNAANVWNRRNLFTWQDDLTMTHGKHQLSFGFWFQPVQDNDDTASRQLGQASFASLTTFLQGTTTSFQVVPNPSELAWRSFFGAWYAEDNFRIRRNLTLRLGLRYEFTTGWNEAKDRAANYVTDSNGVLQTAPLVGHSVYTTNNATHLLGPRAGLAWDVFGNGKTAVRAGFGIYYSLIDDLSFLLNSLPPSNGSATFAGSLPAFLPVVRGAQPPPSCGPGVTTTCTTFAPQGVQADAKTPTVNEWNLAVEQQIDRNTSVRLAYVGSFGYHGLVSVDPNSIPAQVCGTSAGCLAGGNGTTRSTVAQGTTYIPVSPTRPNQYLSAGFFWYTEGNSSYNSLQFDVNRRLARGLEFRANYTWSKNLDMNSALTGAQANNQAQMVMNREDLRTDWGPSALNARNQASLSARYELPFARNNRWLGGWQLNAITTLLSGFPITPQIGSNRSGDADTRNPDRPNLNTAFTGPVIEGTPTQWFNPAAFVLPAPGTFGSAGRGILTGPGLADLDLSLFKNIPVGERLHLQIRSEFFNALNRANFGTPNAIVFSNGAISSTAGLITSTATTSRQIQFGMKLTF